MSMKVRGAGREQLDQLFTQLIDTESERSFNQLSSRITRAASGLGEMERLNAENLLLQIRTEKKIAVLTPQSSERVQLQEIKERAQRIDDIHTQMQLTSKAPAAKKHVKELQCLMNEEAVQLESLTSQPLDKEIQSLGRALSQTAKIIAKEPNPIIPKEARLPLERPWDKPGFMNSDEQKVFAKVRAIVGSSRALDRELLGKAVSPSSLLIKARFPDREPEEYELVAYQHALADELEISRDDIDMVLATLDSKVGSQCQQASTEYFIQHTEGVSTGDVSGLPNRAVDCFLNSALQVLAQDYMDVLNPEINPITDERLKQMTPIQLEAFKEAGVIPTKTNTAQNRRLIQSYLTGLQRDIHSIALKVNGGVSVSPVEIGRLREKLHTLGIITAEDHQQEDASLVKGRIIEEILAFTEGMSRYEVESQTSSTIVDADILEREEVTRDALPVDVSIYEEHPEASGVYTLSVAPQVSYDHGRSIVEGTSWSPISEASVEDIREDDHYIKALGGKLYRIRASRKEIKTKVTKAADVLSVSLGRVPEDEARALGLPVRARLHVPSEIEVGGHRYVLSAYLSHVGRSSTSGHYISNRLVRNRSGKGQWHLCNDSTVYRYGASVPKDGSSLPSGPGYGGDEFRPEALLAYHSTALQYHRVS